MMASEATRVLLALPLLPLLLLLGVPQRADSRPCPRPCSCPQPVELHCTFRSLIAIPPGISNEVQRINLGFNSIHQMTDRSLSGLRKLELLMLHGNDLHGVPDGALRDLTSLQMLKMSYNKLRQITRRSLQGLWSLARLHLDHNRLEFIHPDAFQGLTSLRVLQLEGNRLRQLHPATFSTFSLLSHFHVSTLRHLYLADNNLTSLQPGLLESAPLLENLQLHGNLWNCDCNMRWLQGWDKNNPGVLKCKKDKDYPGGELCPMCAFPRRLRGKEVQAAEVKDMVCSGPLIVSPPRATEPEDPASEEIMTEDAFREPLGNVTLGLSDEHGNKVDLECAVGEARVLGRVNWEQVSQHRLAANMSWSVDLDCPVDRENYERLWRLVAYYSDVPAHLQREAMLSKDPRRSYRYRQDMERDAQYFTGVRVIVMAQPRWLMQASLGLRLNRPQSTGKRVKLVLSSQLSQMVEPELERRRSRTWVTIESDNTAQMVTAAVVGGTGRMTCTVRSSGGVVVHWITPDGSQLTVPYGGPNGRVTALSDGQLVIKSIDHSDMGLYYCVAKVHGDIDVLPFRLAVEESSSPSPGDNRLQLSPIQGYVGQPIALPCEASCSPYAEIYWILPGSHIVSTRANSSRAFVYPNGSLQVPHGQLSDSGYYKCVAVNPHGVDTLATKVNVTRPVAQTVTGTQRKFTKRPQSASGVRTKIKVRAEEPLDGSGGGQVMKDGDTRTAANVGKRRVPISGRRVGLPTRNTWRRPPVLRKPLQPPVEFPRNASADGSHRRVNVASNKIDPRKWADILAKVRDKTVQSNVTPNTVRQTTERKRTLATPTTTVLLEGNMEGSGEFAPTASMYVVTTTNHIPGTPGISEGSNRIAHATSPDLRTNTVHMTPHPRKTQSTQVDLSTRLTQTTRVASNTPLTHGSFAAADATDNAQGVRSAQTPRDAEPFTPGAPVVDSGLRAARTRLPAPQQPTTSAPQSGLTRWQTHTNRTSGPGGSGGASADDASQGNQANAGDTDAGVVTTTHNASHSRRGEGEGERGEPAQRQRHSEDDRLLSADVSRAVSPPAAPTQPKLSVKFLRQPSTAPPEVPTPPSDGLRSPPATEASERGRGREEGPPRQKRPHSKRKNGGRGRNKENRRKHKLNAAPQLTTTTTATSTPVNTLPARASATSAPLKIESAAFTSMVDLRTAVPFTVGQVTSSAAVSHKESTVSRLDQGDKAGLARRPSSSSPDPADRLVSTVTPSPRATRALRTSPLSTSPSSSKDPVSTEALATTGAMTSTASLPGARSEGETSGEHVPTVSPQSFPSASPLSPVTASSEAQRGSSVPGERGPASRSEESPGSDHTPPQWNPDVRRQQSQSGRQYTHSQLAENELVGKVRRPVPLPPPPASSPDPTAQHASSASSSGEHEASGTEGLPGDELYEDVSGKRPTNTNVGDGQRKQTADPEGKSAASTPTSAVASTPTPSTPTTSTPTTSSEPLVSSTALSSATPIIALSSSSSGAGRGIPPPLTTLRPVGSGFNHIEDGYASRDEAQEGQGGELPPLSPHGQSRNVGANQTLAGANPTPAVLWRETLNRNAVDLHLGPIPTSTTPDLLNSVLVDRTATRAPALPSTAATAPPPSAPPSSSGASREGHPTRPLPPPGPLPSPAAPPRANPWILRVFDNTVTVNAETDAQLPCEAVGQPYPFLSWTKVSTGASIAQNTKVNRFEVHPNGTLLIRRAQPTDRGQYLCRVQSQHGRDQVTLNLVVLLRHPKVLQPRHRDVTAHQGAAVHLDCTVLGHPPPSVTWVLPDLVRVLTASQPTAASDQRLALLGNGTLRIAPAGPADRGVYRCVGSSVAGNDAVTVRLNVLPSAPPAIAETERENASLAPGESGFLHCTAAGSPPPVVRWSTPTDDGGPPLANIRVFPNGTLQVRSAVPGNAGRYECMAVSALGVARRTVFLSVTRPARLAKARISAASPRSTEVAYGGTLRLDCLATGHPEPRIIWRTPTQKLVDSQYSYDPRIKVFPNGSLALRPVTEKDAGDFLCLVRNRLGDDFAALSVAVLTRPAKIQRQRLRSSQEVAYGGRLRVDCVASGMPDPSISWALPDGTMVNAADKRRAGRSRRYVVFDNGSLLLNEVGAPQEGDYTCYAENQLGKDQMKVSVKVKGAGLGGEDRPRVVSVPYGQTASLHCGAQRGSGSAGPGSFVVSWVSPTNRVLAPVPGKYQILGDGTLVVHRVQRSDGGNYTCAAARNAGGGRAVTALEVLLAAPSINGLPAGVASAVVTATAGRRGGAPLLVDCVAAGTPPPRTMWVLPGNVVLPVPYRSGGGAGRTTVHANGTLEIRDPRRGDAGRLTCVARNEGGEARLEVDLTVREASDSNRDATGGPWDPQSVAQIPGGPWARTPRGPWAQTPGARTPGDQTPGGPQTVPLTVGRTMVLNCSLPGVPAAALTWVLPGGLPLPSGARLPLVSHRPTDGALLLLRPSAADAGVYRCLAHGHPGNAVTVTPPDPGPALEAPVVVLNGRSFWLHCGGSGALSWTLPIGAVLARATQAGRYAVLPNGTLAVRQASAHDRGVYTCRTAGAEMAVEVVVALSHAPRITNGPPPATSARRGVALQLNCAVAAAAGGGVSRAEVAWETPDRARLPVGTQPRLYGNKYVHPQGALVIQNPTARDAGMYRCTARNAAGVDSRATYLSVF